MDLHRRWPLCSRGMRHACLTVRPVCTLSFSLLNHSYPAAGHVYSSTRCIRHSSDRSFSSTCVLCHRRSSHVSSRLAACFLNSFQCSSMQLLHKTGINDDVCVFVLSFPSPLQLHRSVLASWLLYQCIRGQSQGRSARSANGVLALIHQLLQISTDRCVMRSALRLIGRCTHQQ